jgi:hypothetical protein
MNMRGFVKTHFMLAVVMVVIIPMGLIYLNYYSQARVITGESQEGKEMSDHVFITAHNAEIDRLEDRLEAANTSKEYLRNRTLAFAVSPTIVPVKTVEKVVEKESNYAEKDYQPQTHSAYIPEPIKKPPKANILHQIMAHGGSYTDAYQRAQKGGK